MTDDFFAKIDATLGKNAADEANAEDETAAAVLFAERVVPDLANFARTMAAGLRSRGISAEVQAGKTTIRFKMQYGNGDRHDLYFGLDRQSRGFERIGYFTDEKGKQYSSTDGAVHREAGWNPRVFQEALERHVADYVAYAPRHRGVC